MNIVLPSLSTTGHCCVCSAICHHIGPIRLCADHKDTTTKVLKKAGG